MQLAATRWTSAALVLILTSLTLYLFVVVSERGEGIRGQREGRPHAETGEPKETLLGIHLDNPFIVTSVLGVWSLIALGLVWQARWALTGGSGWGVLSVLGDGFELVNKARDADWGLAGAALVVGLMHLGIVYTCFRAARQVSASSAS